MRIVKVSSKGQIVLPVAVRRRLGLGAGARLELIDEPASLRLRVLRSVRGTSAEQLAGLVTAPATGRRRRLGSFDLASLLARPHR
jgi:AbrB family looped-hinge helix DNA binding protein